MGAVDGRLARLGGSDTLCTPAGDEDAGAGLQEVPTTNDKEIVMKSFKLAAHSLLLSLALMGSAFAAEKVNVNTADAATIDRVLLNVGPAKAEAIVAHRKQNGAFKSMEQLALVKGIGLKTVEKNRDRIALGGAPAAKPAKAKKAVAKR